MVINLYLIIGCNVTKEDNCIYTFDLMGIKNGGYKCFFKNKNVREIGTVKNDSLLINEQIIFYSNNIIKEYNFYNSIGQKRYIRKYDIEGNVIRELGDFFCYSTLKKQTINLRDTTILSFYIASPPNTSYQIFGLNNKGRYEMKLIDTDKSYIKRRKIYANKPGFYLFQYEVEFIDEITKTKEVRKDEITFTVIPSTLQAKPY